MDQTDLERAAEGHLKRPSDLKIHRRRSRVKDGDAFHLGRKPETRAAGVGCWEMDLIANRRVWSSETIRMHGMTGRLSPGQHVELNSDLMHPEDQERLRVLHQELKRGQDRYEFEYRTRVAGRERWISARGRVISRDDAGPRRITGVAIDVTDRKTMEQALRLSEERLRALAEAMPQLVWISDASGKIIYYNSRRSHYQQEPQGGDRSEWQALIHPDDLEPTNRKWKISSANGEDYEMEHRLRLADGRYAWHLSRATAIWGENGEILNWYGTATDIDALKSFQAKLEQSEERLRLATESARMFAWEVDIQTERITWADNAAAVLQCDQEELSSDLRDGSFFVLPEERSRVTKLFLSALHGSSDTFSLEFSGLPLNERKTYWRTEGKLIRNEAGQPIRAVGVTQNISDQHAAELELRIFADRLSTAEAAAGALVYEWEAGSEVLWRSRALRPLLGWQADEIGPGLQGWSELIHPDDRERVRLIASGNAAGEGDDYTIEYRMRHKQGHYIWVLDSGRLFRDKRGRIVRQAGAVIDLTARKAIEEQLRRKADLVELSFEPIFVWHPVRGIVEWNRGAENLYGYARDEAIGRDPQKLLGSRHPLSAAELIERLVAETTWTGEVENITKDGRPIIVESRYQLIRSNGEYLILETDRDTSERRRAEEQNARIAAVAASSHEALFGTTLEGCIEAWNPGAERLFGYEAHEVMGKHIEMLAPPEYRREQAENLQRVRSGETVGPFNTRRQRNDGTQIDVSVAFAPVVSPDGEVQAISIAMHDITERKEWEQRQLLMSRELAHRVKNSFAILQAILRSTLRESPDPEEFATAFSGRLHSLAAAQDVITDSNWRGAEFGALVNHVLAPYISVESHRIRSNGPRIDLAPEHAAPFGLILNELATNAMKYGALSNKQGWIELEWRQELKPDGRFLQFVWREKGGPAVKAERRKGFGSRLIEKSLADARVEIEHPAEGLICRIELKLR